MVLLPPVKVLPWDFFRGKVCHMLFPKGELLPHGIISGGGGLGGGGGGGGFPCDTGNVLNNAFIIYVIFSPVRSTYVVVIVMSY